MDIVKICSQGTQIQQLPRCKTIRESKVKASWAKARAISVEESNVQGVDSPVTRCDDIHAQFYDFKEWVVRFLGATTSS